MIDELKRLLAPLLARRLSAPERRALAQALRAEADRQEQLAAAGRREQRRPAAARVSTSGRGGRPGAHAIYIRVEPRPERHEPILTMRIGRALYDAYQAQRPDPADDLRFTVQVVGRRLYLDESPDGYLVNANIGGVRLNVSGSRDALGPMEPLRRYAAEVQRGRIVADLT